MGKNIRFAIIGCGRIATRHAAEILKHGVLIGVADIIEEKAKAFAKKYNTKPYTSVTSLIQQEVIDVIAVCTPNGLHSTHSIQSLDAGINVLCEKPMALTTSDAEKMIRAAEKNEKKLFVVKQNRYNPPVMFVKKLLDEKKLGKINSFQLNCFWNRPPEYFTDGWRGTLNMDGGILFTQFSHFIDLLYHFLGEIKNVTGMRANFLHKESIAFEDFGIANLQMVNGSVGTLNYTINAVEKNMEGSLALFGEKGTVKIGGQYLNELEYFSVTDVPLPHLQKGNPANEYGFYTGSMSNHDKVYDNLIKTLADPAHPFINMSDILKVTTMIESIYENSPFIK